jgi:membrane-associated phospholipid phosphatase
MADRANLRTQYIKQRKNVIENFKQSRTNIPVVSDDIIYGIPNFRGLYSKGFVGHTGPNGKIIHPNLQTYTTFIDGIKNRDQSKINQICSSCPRLVDPYSLFDVEMEGKYKSTFTIPLAPHPLSNQAAAELLEVYAMALLRDFDLRYFDYGITYDNQMFSDIRFTLDELSNYFDPPRRLYSTGARTLEFCTLFRGNSKGDLIGPYISQFFFYETAVGNYILDQKYYLLDKNNPNPDLSYNFGITQSYFIDLWNGVPKSSNLNMNFRYLTTLRDMATYINRDQVWQPFFVAATILLNRGIPTGFYTSSRTSDSGRFINLGVVDLYNLMMKAVKLAMNAAWVWKWSQLKQRPEEMAYQVHISKTQPPDLSLNFPSFLLNNQTILQSIYNKYGNYLMPLSYSAGSPCHPSYPAGHATIAGAMSTILKAWFNCDCMMTAVFPDVSGQKLFIHKEKYYIDGNNDSTYTTAHRPYADVLLDKMYLNIGHELDKMASNCSYSRCMAGIHYRSDSESGILLGEQIAIELLKDEVNKYNDKIAFQFRKRNGEVIKIANHNDTLIPKPYPTDIFLTFNKNTYTEVINVYQFYRDKYGINPIYSSNVKVIELSSAVDNPTAIPNSNVSPILS